MLFRVHRFTACQASDEVCNGLFLGSFCLGRLVRRRRVYVVRRYTVVRYAVTVCTLHATQSFSPISVGARSFITSRYGSNNDRRFGHSLRVDFRAHRANDFGRHGVSITRVIVCNATAKGPPRCEGLILFHRHPIRFHFRPLVLTCGCKQDALPGRRCVFYALLRRVLFDHRVRANVHGETVCGPRRTGDIS